MQTKNKWGGKRQNAGRKKSESSKKTIVIRVDEELLGVITELKEKHKSGCDIANLINVTNNQDVVKSELEQYKKTGLKLVLERDKERQHVIKLRTSCKGLESKNKALKTQLEALEHKIYDCQALKKDGNRCTRPAKVKTNWHGVEINTCIQHSGIKTRRW